MTYDEELDLYRTFIYNMPDVMFNKFHELPRSRKDYLFKLWLEAGNVVE